MDSIDKKIFTILEQFADDVDNATSGGALDRDSLVKAHNRASRQIKALIVKGKSK